jgi:hypothetical protein
MLHTLLILLTLLTPNSSSRPSPSTQTPGSTHDCPDESTLGSQQIEPTSIVFRDAYSYQIIRFTPRYEVLMGIAEVATTHILLYPVCILVYQEMQYTICYIISAVRKYDRAKIEKVKF